MPGVPRRAPRRPDVRLQAGATVSPWPRTRYRTRHQRFPMQDKSRVSGQGAPDPRGQARGHTRGHARRAAFMQGACSARQTQDIMQDPRRRTQNAKRKTPQASQTRTRRIRLGKRTGCASRPRFALRGPLGLRLAHAGSRQVTHTHRLSCSGSRLERKPRPAGGPGGPNGCGHTARESRSTSRVVPLSHRQMVLACPCVAVRSPERR